MYSWLKAYGSHGLKKFWRAFYLPLNQSILSTHKLFTKIEIKYGVRHSAHGIRITKIQKQFDISYKINSSGNRSDNWAMEPNCISKTWNKNVAMIFIGQIGLDYICKWFSEKLLFSFHSTQTKIETPTATNTMDFFFGCCRYFPDHMNE